MRHGAHKYKLGVKPQHRKALVQNLAIELITHQKIRTTDTKARAIKPFVEKLVTLAKVDTVANRRLAFTKLNNKEAVKGSVFGKNNSLSNTAIWTQSIKSKYSNIVPIDNNPTASFCSLVRLFCSNTSTHTVNIV